MGASEIQLCGLQGGPRRWAPGLEAMSRLNIRALVAIYLLLSATDVQADLVIDDAVFAHDFESSPNAYVPLVGPTAVPYISGFASSQIPLRTTGTLPFSTQHIESPIWYSHVDTNTRLSAASSALSFSIFFNAQGDNGNDADMGQARLLSSFDGDGNVAHDYITFDTVETSPTTRTLRFTARSGAVVNSYSSSTTFVSRDSDWHAAGFTFEGGATDGTLTFYLDGQVFGSPITTSGMNSIAAQDNNWYLLEDKTSAVNATEYFDQGHYDEAGLWTRTLSAHEMNALFSSGLGAAQPASVPEPAVAWLPMLVLIGARLRRWYWNNAIKMMRRMRQPLAVRPRLRASHCAACVSRDA